MGMAVGLIEVYGLTAAFVAADAMCKAANVSIEAFDRNKPAAADELPVPLVVLVKIRGSVEDVRTAIVAGEYAAEEISGVLAKHVIPNPDNETEKILKILDLDKKK